MEKIRFRAKQLPTGIKGAVMLEAQEMVDELTEFLRAEHAYARAKKQKDPEYELEFDCQLKRWYRRRSLNANNLAWELCTRLGQVDGVSKETVYYAIKELTDLPRDEYKGVFVQRASSDLTTVEFAKFIERLVIECQTHDPTIEIHDIWILFTEWRFGQDKDPLEGSYFGKDDYREKHPCCEGCGKYLLYTGNEGELRHAGEVAHIVAAGSGGADEDWNWLLLCNQGHVQLQHQKGWNAFLKGHEHLRAKVERALSRAGKAPVDSRTPVQDEVPLPPPDPVAEEKVADGEGVDGSNSQTVAEDVARVREQARLVQKTFGGTVVEGTIPAAPDPEPDEAKQLMLDRLAGMTKTADEKQAKYYGNRKSEPDAVDPKKAQYKED